MTRPSRKRSARKSSDRNVKAAAFGIEIECQRRNKKLMAFLDKATQETEWIPLADVAKRLRLPPRKLTPLV
jgi:hypothetical protein